MKEKVGSFILMQGSRKRKEDIHKTLYHRDQPMESIPDERMDTMDVKGIDLRISGVVERDMERPVPRYLKERGHLQTRRCSSCA